MLRAPEIGIGQGLLPWGFLQGDFALLSCPEVAVNLWIRGVMSLNHCLLKGWETQRENTR